jgi:hypothetical protein
MVVKLIKKTDDLGNIIYWVEKDDVYIDGTTTDDFAIAFDFYNRAKEAKYSIEVMMSEKID